MASVAMPAAVIQSVGIVGRVIAVATLPTDPTTLPPTLPVTLPTAPVTLATAPPANVLRLLIVASMLSLSSLPMLNAVEKSLDASRSVQRAVTICADVGGVSL